MNNKKYEFRASTLYDVLQNPRLYFEPPKDISNLEAVKNGIKREPLSYKLYELISANKDYTPQKEARIETDRYILTGHCDIVTNTSIIDIKNSKQKDSDLIKQYTYQLAVYKELFFPMLANIKTQLFVDTNKDEEMDISKCRFVDVDVSDIDIPTILNKLCDVLDNMVLLPSEDENDYLQKYIKQYETGKENKEKAESELKYLEAKIDEYYEHHKDTDCKDYVLVTKYTRNIKYITTKKPTKGDGEYKEQGTILKK